MERGFVYLVAIMDWYTRKYKIAQAIACFVLSWRVSTSMDAAFCVEALQEAIIRWGCPEIFNTDQGVQFTVKPSPMSYRQPVSRSVWMVVGAGWTTFLLSDYGAL